MPALQFTVAEKLDSSLGHNVQGHGPIYRGSPVLVTGTAAAPQPMGCMTSTLSPESASLCSHSFKSGRLRALLVLDRSELLLELADRLGLAVWA
jgi:hypothetical protein